MLTPTFRDHHSFRLAGLRRFHTFADAPRDIPAQWAEFNQLPIPGLHATKIFYGATCQTDLPNQRFEYMCAFEIPDLSIAPPDGRMIVPAAHYAVFTDPKGLATLHNTWQYIWKQWLPASGVKPALTPALTPDFERYDERFNPTTLEGPVEIWFPIQRQP
jgi:AraC family transcriptional regulator